MNSAKKIAKQEAWLAERPTVCVDPAVRRARGRAPAYGKWLHRPSLWVFAMGPCFRIHADESRRTEGVDLLPLTEVMVGHALQRAVMIRGVGCVTGCDVLPRFAQVRVLPRWQTL